MKWIAHLAISLDGSVQVQSASLYPGDPQVCTYRLENRGILNLPTLPLRELVVDLDNGQEVKRDAVEANLPSGGSYSSIRGLETGDFAVGAHGCVLQAEIDGAWVPLAYEYFQVLEPPICIDAGFGPGERGRVLVLLDDAGDACTGLTALGVESGFVTPLAADAQVSVELRDADGQLLDSEATTLDTREINQHPGTGDIDLLIEDFSTTHLTIAIQASATGQLGAGYRLLADVTQASGSLALDSGLMVTDCIAPLHVDELLGDFRVSNITEQGVRLLSSVFRC